MTIISPTPNVRWPLIVGEVPDGVTYVCGRCDTVLAEKIAADGLTRIFLRCWSCKQVNQLDPSIF